MEPSEVELTEAKATFTSSPVLQTIVSDKAYGASLLRVASSFRFVFDDTRVEDVAHEFQQVPDLLALGICAADGKALGLITRQALFAQLGKPFGQEILNKKPIGSLVESAPAFDQHDNLFHVVEQLQSQMDRASIYYFLLTSTGGKFAGIFSSKDILSYLSRITQEDITLAGQLQERLVPRQARYDHEKWQAEAFSQSAKGLGGDFYHIHELPDGRLFLALGDVSGKGAAASILTSLLWGVLEFYDYRKGLKTLIQQLNEALIRTFHLEKYLTAVFLLVDWRRHEVVIADMGHGHNWIIRGGRPRPLRFPSMNLPLGIDQALSPQLYRFHVRPGDFLLFYTDGLTEQVNPAGEEWGEERLLTHLLESLNQGTDIIPRLLKAVENFQAGVPRLDDMTWLQLAVK